MTVYDDLICQASKIDKINGAGFTFSLFEFSVFKIITKQASNTFNYTLYFKVERLTQIIFLFTTISLILHVNV